jgi:hypothetical protein
MAFHKDEVGSSLHVVHFKTYASAAARTGDATLVSADIGKIAKQTDTNRYYLLINNVGPVWSEITTPSGGGSGVNYVSNPNSEDNTAGWATYADAAGVFPVDGTGGSPNITLVRSTSNPLRNQASFLLTKDAANRQGEGVSVDFTIDRADLANVLSIEFDFEPGSGFVAGSDSTNSDLVVYLYDVTNSQLIQPAPYKIVSGVGIQSTFRAAFQTNSNSFSYRLILHVATTSATGWTFKFDNVRVGPQAVLFGSPMSDWNNNLTFTPNNFGTVSNSDFWTRRVGDTLEVEGYFLSGTPAAATASITLPSGYSIDTAKISASAQRLQVGEYFQSSTVSTNFTTARIGAIHVNPSDPTKVFFAVSGGATSGLINLDDGSNVILTANSGMSIKFSIPILGWQSNVQMSNDTDTRVVALIATGDPASATAGNPIIFPTAIKDTHNAYSAITGLYTAPVSGYYQINGYLEGFNASEFDIAIAAYVNASVYVRLGRTDSQANATLAGTVFASAGQTISIRPEGTSYDAGSASSLQITRVSGPNAIAANELVAVRYEVSGSTANPSVASGGTEIIDFDTSIINTHGSVTTGASWQFTAPVSGIYRVSVCLDFGAVTAGAIGQGVAAFVFKNGVSNAKLGAQRYQTTGGATNQMVSGSNIVKCLAGDTLDIRVTQNSGSALSLSAGAGEDIVSIERIGF